jgi:hypothetical protein
VTVIFDARRARLLPLDVDGNALCAALRLPYPERREHADMFGPMDRRRARGPGNVPWGSPADGVTARRDYTVEVRSSFRHRNRDQ